MRTLIVCLIFVSICLAAGCSSYRVIKVPTGAMQPTIKVDATVISDDSAYSSGKSVERFDLVVHTRLVNENDRKLGINENTNFIFRIIGLGGEKVELKNGAVFVNDARLNEPFEKYDSDDNFGPIIVPENEFFLLGDNRPESNDSRFWKPSTIKRENIISKVIKIF